MATLLENNTLNLQNVNQTVQDLFHLNAVSLPYGSQWEQSLFCGSTITKIDNYYITVSGLGIFISTTGTDWQQANNTSTLSFNASEFNIYKHNNIYYLAQYYGNGVVYSYDLITWYDSKCPVTSIYNLYYFNNTLFCTSNKGVYKYSDTLLDWVQINSSTSSYMVVCQGDLFILSGSYDLYTSTDNGSTWEVCYTFADYSWNLTTLNTTLCVGGNGGLYMSADKGITWNKAYDTEGNQITNSFDATEYEYNDIISKYIVTLVIPYSSSRFYYTTEDFITLTNISVPQGSICSNIYIEDNSIVLYSYQSDDSSSYFLYKWKTQDLNNWSCEMTMSLSSYINDVGLYNNTLFVAGEKMSGSGSSASKIFYSSDFTKLNIAYTKGASFSSFNARFHQIDNLFYMNNSSYTYFINN